MSGCFFLHDLDSSRITQIASSRMLERKPCDLVYARHLIYWACTGREVEFNVEFPCYLFLLLGRVASALRTVR